jgi:hypothetical protein
MKSIGLTSENAAILRQQTFMELMSPVEIRCMYMNKKEIEFHFWNKETGG